MLLRRRSTAGSSHDRLYRRAPCSPRGRADLPRFADRRVAVSHTCRWVGRSGQAPARARRDVTLRTKIRRVSEATFRVYGVRKVWRPLLREGIAVARCTVARLMWMRGLRGIGRGKPVRTTISNAAAPCPLDRVKRPFKAPRPNALWLSDFTSVATC